MIGVLELRILREKSTEIVQIAETIREIEQVRAVARRNDN